MAPRPKIVLTGIGLRIPGASDLDSAAKLYRSAIAATRPLDGDLEGLNGGAVDAPLDGESGDKFDRVSALALAASADAVKMAGLENRQDLLRQAGVYAGCGGGGLASIEKSIVQVSQNTPLKSNALIKTLANAPTAHISIAYGCQGPTMTYAMACSSALHAIGEAMMALQLGKADIMIAGGCEAPLTLSLHRSWMALRLLAQGKDAKCRPFSYERAGLLLGEGSVFFVLETESAAKQRGANVLCEIKGYGARSDATNMLAPNAEGQAQTIAAALKDARLSAGDIGHISAHGTATLAGDVSETNAVKCVFGAHAYNVPISATKSVHGHLLGAAGGVSLLASFLAVREGLIAPTVNYGTPDPELDLDYTPNAARDIAPVNASLCNAFGFGGSNASLIIGSI